VVLEQVVSRHDPHFDVARARLAVGRDGNVYLANGHGNGGRVLRVTPDGKRRSDGAVGYSTMAVAARKDGTVATAEAHFPHRTAFWGAGFAPLGHVPDFLVSDTVQWNAPSDVAAGDSGDFYAVDQHRVRVLRVAPPDKLAEAYSLESTGEKSKGGSVGLRVDEKRKHFVTAWSSGTVWASGFDGKPLWSIKARPVGETPGGFDLDADGTLHILTGGPEIVKAFDLDGKPAGEVKLVPDAARKPYPIHDLRVLDGSFIVKRSDPTTLFEVYDRKSGTLVRRVAADVEVLTVRYPSAVWTAGVPVPLEIGFQAGRPTKPKFRAFLRPLGVPEFTELALTDGKVTPPKSARGLYQVRVTPDIHGRVAEYTVDGFVEIRALDAKGTVSIFTPLNRFDFGRGEEITLSVVVRAAKGAEPPKTVTVKMLRGLTPVAERDVTIDAQGRGTATFAAKDTRELPVGRYTLDAEVLGFTVAPQYIELGLGLNSRPKFHLVQHGDYSYGFPPGPRPGGVNLPRLIDVPETATDHVSRSRKLGLNLFVDRLGHQSGLGSLSEVAKDDVLVERLKADPLAVAPEKAMFEGSVRRTVAGYGAHGIEEQAILLYMDAGLPVGTLFDSRKPEQMEKDIQTASEKLLPYPAFRGWSWAANWWLEKHGAGAARDAAEKKEYEAALKAAKETGKWSPVLEEVSTRTFAHAVEAEKRFRAALHAAAPGKLSVVTGPYRAIQTHPPVIFAGADEVDLHYQAEQIQPPQVTPHHVDFYKRPGKPAWGHPELWNDDGTGGMIFPTLLQMAMRGADGVGESGPVGPWAKHDPTQSDPRSAAAGTTSAFRTIYELLRLYGPWLTTLERADKVAIVVSTRMQRIETWDGRIGGAYFDALFEAYSACLYAHRPASFVFVEDLKPNTLNKYKAVLVVNQRVELDPPLADALTRAAKDGVRVFADGTCRQELVKDFTPLGVSFDRVKQDPHAWQDDAAYFRFPQYFKAHAEVLRKALGSVVPPVAECSNPEIMLTERRSGVGRFVWAVNNTMLGWDPGLAWRLTLQMTHRVPVVEQLKLDVPDGWVVYDVFAQQQVEHVNGTVSCDLRSMPARLYAILPRPIKGVGMEYDPPLVIGGPPPTVLKWTATVGDDAAEIDASLPIRVTLRDQFGRVLHETITAGGRTGAKGETVFPPDLNDNYALEVMDLVSGIRQGLTVGKGRVKGRTANPAGLFGPHVRDIAISADGATALLNTFNWDHNLYALNLDTGATAWRQKIGHGFAFDPRPLADGFAVQGFDVSTGAGYHLYALDRAGKPIKRHALFGLPKRATGWASGSQLQDEGINSFATPPSAGWVASAGDLGLVVWNRDGKELWADEWWRTTRKRVGLVALEDETLVVLGGTTATARDPLTGKERWSIRLADAGTLRGGTVSADRKTLVIRSDTLGGRLFVIRDGKLVNAIVAPAEEVAVAPTGVRIAVTSGRQLKVFDPTGGLLWTYTGDDTLRHPRFAPNGLRIAVGSELGTLAVLDTEGKVEGELDLHSLPVPAWLPNGDLLAATWTGTVIRFDKNLAPVWEKKLAPAETDARSKLLAKDQTPTVGKTGWGNATAKPLPLTPNLLVESKAIISAVHDPKTHGDPRPWQNKIERLIDGKPDAPPKPWLEWTDIGYIDSGWRNKLVLEIDTFRTQLRVTGVTFVEDPSHPESWLRDVRVQWWDAAASVWRDGPYLLSDAATHSHVFEKPIEAAKFRLVSTGGGTWPIGNLRLGELVFHGEVLGCSHPDAVAKNSVAVLFDESEADVTSLKYPGRPFAFKYGGAFSGGKCLELSAPGDTGPAWVPPFGHAIPNWDFEIAEKPGAGQYRYLQFAWKATSDKTTGAGLLLGRAWPGGGVAVVAGDAKWKEGVIVEHRVEGKPPSEWTTVRVDLWALTKGKPPRIQALSLMAVGGGAVFDQIVLGRTPEDLDRLKPAK
jgi:outer membrane protein assembly factor BamB